MLDAGPVTVVPSSHHRPATCHRAHNPSGVGLCQHPFGLADVVDRSPLHAVQPIHSGHCRVPIAHHLNLLCVLRRWM